MKRLLLTLLLFVSNLSSSSGYSNRLILGFMGDRACNKQGKQLSLLHSNQFRRWRPQAS